MPANHVPPRCLPTPLLPLPPHLAHKARLHLEAQMRGADQAGQRWEGQAAHAGLVRVLLLPVPILLIEQELVHQRQQAATLQHQAQPGQILRWRLLRRDRGWPTQRGQGRATVWLCCVVPAAQLLCSRASCWQGACKMRAVSGTHLRRRLTSTSASVALSRPSTTSNVGLDTSSSASSARRAGRVSGAKVAHRWCTDEHSRRSNAAQPCCCKPCRWPHAMLHAWGPPRTHR